VPPVFHTGCTPGCTTTALDPAQACSCTAAAAYWSSTTFGAFPSVAWGIFFEDANVNTFGKLMLLRVRAVRKSR
jgi:hypothetical protein